MDKIKRQFNSNNILDESLLNSKYKQKLKKEGMYNVKNNKEKLSACAVELQEGLNLVIREHLKQIISDLVSIKMKNTQLRMLKNATLPLESIEFNYVS